MTTARTHTPVNEADGGRPRGRPGDEALTTGLSLILADAARSHLKAGDLDKATLCLKEAERCLASLSSP